MAPDANANQKRDFYRVDAPLSVKWRALEESEFQRIRRHFEQTGTLPLWSDPAAEVFAALVGGGRGRLSCAAVTIHEELEETPGNISGGGISFESSRPDLQEGHILDLRFLILGSGASEAACAARVVGVKPLPRGGAKVFIKFLLISEIDREGLIAQIASAQRAWIQERFNPGAPPATPRGRLAPLGRRDEAGGGSARSGAGRDHRSLAKKRAIYDRMSRAGHTGRGPDTPRSPPVADAESTPPREASRGVVEKRPEAAPEPTPIPAPEAQGAAEGPSPAEKRPPQMEMRPAEPPGPVAAPKPTEQGRAPSGGSVDFLEVQTGPDGWEELDCQAIPVIPPPPPGFQVEARPATPPEPFEPPAQAAPEPPASSPRLEETLPFHWERIARPQLEAARLHLERHGAFPDDLDRPALVRNREAFRARVQAISAVNPDVGKLLTDLRRLLGLASAQAAFDYRSDPFLDAMDGVDRLSEALTDHPKSHKSQDKALAGVIKLLRLALEGENPKAGVLAKAQDECRRLLDASLDAVKRRRPELARGHEGLVRALDSLLAQASRDDAVAFLGYVESPLTLLCPAGGPITLRFPLAGRAPGLSDHLKIGLGIAADPWHWITLFGEVTGLESDGSVVELRCESIAPEDLELLRAMAG